MYFYQLCLEKSKSDVRHMIILVSKQLSLVAKANKIEIEQRHTGCIGDYAHTNKPTYKIPCKSWYLKEKNYIILQL